MESKIITAESEQIPRLVRAWLNSYTEKPENIVDYEFLQEESGLALVTIQSSYMTREFILGGYEAQYQFGIVYRTTSAFVSDRIQADEILNNFAAWAEANPIEFEAPLRTVKVRRNTNAALMYAYDNNTEDHQILMTLTYEVNV